MPLLHACFDDDPTYKQLEANYEARLKLIDGFAEDITWMLTNGDCYGTYDGDKLINFLITVPWKRLRYDHAAYEKIIAASVLEQEVVDKWTAIPGDVQYAVLLATDPSYRGAGIARRIWESVLYEYLPGLKWVSDVDNEATLSMYEKFGFTIDGHYNGYWTVLK